MELKITLIAIGTALLLTTGYAVAENPSKTRWRPATSRRMPRS